MAVQHVRKVPFQRITPLEKEAQRQLSRNFDAIVAQLVPTGTGPIPWAGQDGLDPPQGWLLCDGQAVSRTAYASLFRVIGTTYGAGDGSTTFNVPNMSDRFPRGTHLGSEVGDTGGSSTASMPAHNHGAAGAATLGHDNNHVLFGNNFNTSHVEPPNHQHTFGTGNPSANHSHAVGGVVFMNCSATHGHAGGCGQLAESPSFGGCTGFGCNGGTGTVSSWHTHSGTTAGVSVSVAHSHNANHGHGINAHSNHSLGNHTHTTEGSGDNNPPFTDFRFIIKT